MGCIPSKVSARAVSKAQQPRREGPLSGAPPPQALLNSSHKYIEAKEHFKHHGVIVENVSYDFGAIMKQKEDAVSGLTKGIEGLFKKNKVSGGAAAPGAG